MKAMSLYWRFLLVIAWMGLIFRLSSRSTVPHSPVFSDQVAAVFGHFLLYFVLTSLLVFALKSTRTTTLSGTLLVAFVVALTYGFSDEIHQSFVPGRDAAAFDVMVDTCGAFAAICVLGLVEHLSGSRI
jgi:VanZ family protein